MRFNRTLSYIEFTCIFGVVVLLSGCMTKSSMAPVPKDPELSRITSLARSAFERGSLKQADKLYLLALKRAYVMDDPLEIGNAFYNLGACRTRVGKYNEALNLMDEAKASLAQINIDITDIMVLEAKLTYMLRDYGEALILADAVLAQKDRVPSELAAEVYILKGNIACEKGDVINAREEMERAKNRLHAVQDSSSFAHLAGRIFELENAPALAAAEFDHESLLLQKAKRYRAMAVALAHAARAWADSHNWQAASNRFLRAGRSYFGQGLKEKAIEMLDSALAAANRGDDTGTALRIEFLLDEMSMEHQPTVHPEN